MGLLYYIIIHYMILYDIILYYNRHPRAQPAIRRSPSFGAQVSHGGGNLVGCTPNSVWEARVLIFIGHFKDIRALSALRLSKGWVRKCQRLRMRIGCILRFWALQGDRCSSRAGAPPQKDGRASPSLI